MNLMKNWDEKSPGTILLVILFSLIPWSLFAQEEKLTLDIKNGRFETFIKQVESQTHYTFVYRNVVLDPETRVTIVCKDEPILKVLDTVFTPLSIEYSFDGKLVNMVKNTAKSNNTTSGKPSSSDGKDIITGTVYDTENVPLIGAVITVKGENGGTVTNSDGNFELAVSDNAILQVSYIGFKSQEIPINRRGNLTIIMQEDSELLDEIVVVGYGKQKKESVTASISTIGTKELVQTPQSNISNMLVGRLPGLIATQRSGAPGEDASDILIRGVSTFTENTSPLIMIDGVERSSFDGLDPNEIETLNILKDASATAVYGVRGANGVILITTRKGKIGAPKISYSGNIALQCPTALPSYLNSADYATLYNEALRNDSYTNGTVYTPKFSDIDIELYRNGYDPILHPDVDWVEEFLKKVSVRTHHNINVSGGTETVKYFISLGYYDQNGMYKHTKLDEDHDVNPRSTRYNFRTNLDFQITRDLSASMQMSMQVSNVKSPTNGNNSIWKVMSNSNPLNTPGMVDGKVMLVENALGVENPWVSLLTWGYHKDLSNNINTTFRLNYDLSRILLKGLSVHGSVAYDNYYYSRKTYGKTYPIWHASRDEANPGNILVVPDNEETNWSVSSSWGKNRKVYLEFGLDWARKFGKHSLTALLLYNQSKYYSPSLAYYVPNAYQGLVGRITYDYGSRYLAEFNMGYNGTENFAKGKRFGFFPAVSLGWVISQEPYFPKNDYVVFLKIRGSYGEVGNDKIGGDRFLYRPSMYGEAKNLPINSYNFGDASAPNNSLMIIETKLGNPDLTWEKAKKWNVGLEMNMFKDHLRITADFFRERRNNILANRNTEPMLIGASLPAYNFGEMENKGWECDVIYRNNIKDFNYWIRGNYSFARNKILFMDEVTPQYAYQKRTGRRKDQFFGLLFDGFYNSWEEVNALDRPISSWNGNKLQPGDIKYVDVNHDGIIDQYDAVPVGYSPIPEVIYGVSFGMDWKGFDLSVLFQGATNVSIKYFGRALWPFINSRESAKSLIKERWTAERYAAGEPINFPRLSMNPSKNNDNNYQDSDFWIRDASYFRLKNVEIGYTFKGLKTKRLGIESIRLYFSGSNLFTWTDVIDLDPEAPSKSGSVEINTYPLQKVYNLGININF